MSWRRRSSVRRNCARPPARPGAPASSFGERSRSSRRSGPWTVPTARAGCSRSSPTVEAVASPAFDEPLPPHVGGAERGAVARVEPGDHGATIDAERPHDPHEMAEPPERLQHAGRDSILDLQHAGQEAMLAEAFEMMTRVEARRLECLLRS